VEVLLHPINLHASAASVVIAQILAAGGGAMMVFFQTLPGLGFLLALPLAMVGTLVATEALLQLGALLRLLPGAHLSGLFTPYGRVYNNRESSSHALTNQNGWYYPSYRVDEGAERIVLVGGSFVLGLEVPPKDNMGVFLERRLQAERAAPVQVIGMGVPDYSPAVYLASQLYPYTAGRANPKDVIVLFHLANDFQAISASNGQVPFAYLNPQGQIEVTNEDAELRHSLWHVVVRGYEQRKLLRILKTHLFTAMVLQSLIRRRRGVLPHVPMGFSNLASSTAARPFGEATFLFEADNDRARQSLALAVAQLQAWRAEAEKAGTRVLLVTLPHFPAAFYKQNQGTDWKTELGPYDLFLPERALEHYAADYGIPLLPLGQYMRAALLPVETIRGLYFKEGTGHLTAAGHRFVAEAIYDCFYKADPAHAQDRTAQDETIPAGRP
jgi:hypothetical protein